MVDSSWTPGRWLVRLAELLVPERIRGPFVGDLIEETRARAEAQGPARARIWYLFQLMVSTPALVSYRMRSGGRGPSPAARLGILMAVAWILADALFPSRVVWAGSMAAATLLNAIAAVLIWRRTGLRLLAAGTALGAVEAAIGAVAFWMFPAEELFASRVAWLVAGAGLVVYLTAWFVERARNRERWDAWKAHMREFGVLDFFAFRHIPDLERRAN